MILYVLVYGAEPYKKVKEVPHIINKIKKEFKKVFEIKREDGFITFIAKDYNVNVREN